MGLVVLVGSIFSAVLLNRTDDMSRQLTLQIQPSRVAAYQMQAALRDQEAAIRSYLVTADPQFLDDYNQGRTDEQAASTKMRVFEQGRPDLLTDLDTVEQAAGTWRTSYAEPVIAGVPRDDVAATTELGGAEFDRLRGLFR